jgi:hypothetical protein
MALALCRPGPAWRSLRRSAASRTSPAFRWPGGPLCCRAALGLLALGLLTLSLPTPALLTLGMLTLRLLTLRLLTLRLLTLRLRTPGPLTLRLLAVARRLCRAGRRARLTGRCDLRPPH